MPEELNVPNRFAFAIKITLHLVNGNFENALYSVTIGRMVLFLTFVIKFLNAVNYRLVVNHIDFAVENFFDLDFCVFITTKFLLPKLFHLAD